MDYASSDTATDDDGGKTLFTIVNSPVDKRRPVVDTASSASGAVEISFESACTDDVPLAKAVAMGKVAASAESSDRRFDLLLVAVLAVGACGAAFGGFCLWQLRHPYGYEIDTSVVATTLNIAVPESFIGKLQT